MGSLIVNYNADSLNLKRNPIFIHSLRSITIIVYDNLWYLRKILSKKNQTNKQSKGKNNTHIHPKSILLVETTDKVSTD